MKKLRRKGQQAENDKTERVTGLGRRTREEIAKWNQMTARRFQTGGRHQTSPASLRGATTTKAIIIIIMIYLSHGPILRLSQSLRFAKSFSYIKLSYTKR